MQTLLILGRQPQLGLAELESLYGADHCVPIGTQYAVSDLPAQDINFTRLGGSIKLAAILEQLDTTEWRRIEKVLLAHAAAALGETHEGKINCGISVYGATVGPKDLMATGLRLKKALKAATSQSIRLVPLQTDALALNSAQVLHNKLDRENGLEIVIVEYMGRTFICRTVAEQDITAYAKRDQNRPKRDARVGMLPPKLAQIIVNLAVGHDPEHKLDTILDPFCGTGVILQEAALMGYNLYGSDLEPRMIEYTAANLTWLNETHRLSPVDANLEVGDATTHAWKEPFQAVAAEGYLGQPFNNFPAEAKLRDVMQTCNTIAKNFLKNLAEQVPSGTRIAIGLPAWHTPSGGFKHLNMLDQLEELGYNRVSFAHTRAEELLYYRPDQVVAREILVITRK